MAQINLSPEEILEVFRKYCESKNYQVEVEKDSNNDWRLNISNIREKTLIIIYHTGSVVVQGKKNDLRLEFEDVKDELMANPEKFVGHEIKEIKSAVTRYEIVSDEIKKRIREGLDDLDGSVEITETPDARTEYRAKITRGPCSLTMTQFKTGALMLQGKTVKLFHDGCDWIEKIANPAESEIIARFISNDEKNLEYFAARYTPRLLEIAEKNVKEALSGVYEYLETHDQKWFVASECLCLSEIPLPEFSPLVMPASKAFEGFVKKLLVGIGLFDLGYFQTKGANFSALNDFGNANRKAICKKEKYVDSFLKRLSVCLDANRNFMMHSDSSKVTKIDSADEAKDKVATIFKDAREIFGYFNDLYKLFVT